MTGPNSSQDQKHNDSQAPTKKVFDSEKSKEKMEDLYEYARQNKTDTLAYAVIIIGLVLLFFAPFYGGLLIGIIAGIYFYKELIGYVKNRKQMIYEAGTVRSIIFVGTWVGILIAAPGIIIGALVAAAVRYLITPEVSKI